MYKYILVSKLMAVYSLLYLLDAFKSKDKPVKKSQTITTRHEANSLRDDFKLQKILLRPVLPGSVQPGCGNPITYNMKIIFEKKRAVRK